MQAEGSLPIEDHSPENVSATVSATGASETGEEQALPSEPESVPGNGQHFCVRCGKPCAAGERLCNDCKRDLYVGDAETSNEETASFDKKKRKSVALIAVIAILIFAASSFLGYTAVSTLFDMRASDSRGAVSEDAVGIDTSEPEAEIVVPDSSAEANDALPEEGVVVYEDDSEGKVVADEDGSEDALAQVGSYVIRTENRSRLSFNNNEDERGIPYAGIVYASKFKEEDGAIQAYVRFAAVSGWVNLDELSWISAEDYSISVGDTCYVHKRDSEGMNLRQEASSSSSSIGTLYYGTEITIDGFDGCLGKVNASGTEGWVLMQRIAKYVPELLYMTDSLDDSYVEMKVGMDQESETVATIPNGTTMEIVSYEAGWGEVEYEGESGFVQMCHMTPVSEK